MERGLKNRAAGFRTYMLVCIGSSVIMMINQYIFQAYGTGDPTRMGAQVVSGIGFLGAGSIIVTSHNQIKGLTTAAGLWSSACLGLAIGIGLYEVALVGGVTVFLVLTLLHTWEDHFRRKTKVLTLYLELLPGEGIGNFLRDAREHELSFSNIQIERENNYTQGSVCFVCNVKGSKRKKRDDILSALRGLKCILYMEEL
jgi:putative Mg2+ transporter-C (MgtC) family protein